MRGLENMLPEGYLAKEEEGWCGAGWSMKEMDLGIMKRGIV